LRWQYLQAWYCLLRPVIITVIITITRTGNPETQAILNPAS
jgi:hypothetical protein